LSAIKGQIFPGASDKSVAKRLGAMRKVATSLGEVFRVVDETGEWQVPQSLFDKVRAYFDAVDSVLDALDLLSEVRV